MQRNDRWPTDYEPDPRSRRSSTSSRGSRKGKKSPPSSNTSAASTPKKLVKQPEFVVTGKQILKRPDRANSLPASRRRPSLEAAKPQLAPSRRPEASHTTKSRDTSLEGDASLELSQVSDFEDMNSKYGIRRCPQATSTPKKRASLPATTLNKTRDSSHSSKTEVTYRHGMSTDLDYSSVSPEYSGPSSTEASPRQTKGVSQDMSSCCVSSWMESDSETKMERGEWSRFWANYNGSLAPASSYYDQCPTPRGDIGLADLDFSADFSRKHSPEDAKTIHSIIRNEGLHLTPRETQNIIKCAHILGNVLTKAIERSSKEKEHTTDKIQEMAEVDLKKNTTKENVTTDKIQVMAEKEEKDSKKKIVFRGKGHDTNAQVQAEEKDLKNITTCKEKEVIQVLAEKEEKDSKKKTLSTEKVNDTDNTQLSTEFDDEKNKVSETEPDLAEKDEGKDLKKKTLTLHLKETNVPLEIKEEKRCETVTTQTDISLPNTKSAPKIFENILRQLSRSSIDEGLVKKVKDSLDVEIKIETKE